MPVLAFDSTQHEDMRTYKAVPKGDYPMEIVASEMKETKDKSGEYLKLEIEIISGQYKGSRVWTNLNLKNKSQTAVDIAQRELATICRAVGKPKVQNSEELHKIPFIGSVGISPAKGQYPESNKMDGYAPYDPNKATATAPADSVGSIPKAKIPPWAKKRKEAPSADEEGFDSPSATSVENDDIPV